jgi:D-3-phosphoglycerate dehydrogenase
MNILLASPIHSDAIETLRRDHRVECAMNLRPETLRALLRDHEILIFRSGVTLSSEVLEAGSRLKLIIRAGSGFDNVDLGRLRELGIPMVSIPEPSAQAVGELTFALMLDLARKVSLADRLLRAGQWPKSDLVGSLIAGKTLGIVGAGTIGGRVGELGAAWAMRPIGCVEHPSAEAREALRAKGIALADFDAVVASADFLALHVPLKESTYHLIDERALSLMKPGSFLLNLARGGVVDEDALYRELTAGPRLAGAALDVHEKEGEGQRSRFAGLPNVVLTPHIGGLARESQQRIGRRIVELVDSLSGNHRDPTVGEGQLPPSRLEVGSRARW